MQRNNKLMQRNNKKESSEEGIFSFCRSFPCKHFQIIRCCIRSDFPFVDRMLYSALDPSRACDFGCHSLQFERSLRFFFPSL